jgi:hypothetical protein
VRTYAARPASQVGDPNFPRAHPNFLRRQQVSLGLLARSPRSPYASQRGLCVTAG